MIVTMFALKSCGISKKKTAIENVIFIVKLNFVKNVLYLINCTKEANILAIIIRWQGHSNICKIIIDNNYYPFQEA